MNLQKQTNLNPIYAPIAIYDDDEKGQDGEVEIICFAQNKVQADKIIKRLDCSGEEDKT
jgi:hypothetical protein